MKKLIILTLVVLLLLSSCAKSVNTEVQADMTQNAQETYMEIESESETKKSEGEKEVPNQEPNNENANNKPTYKEPLNLFLSPLFTRKRYVCQQSERRSALACAKGSSAPCQGKDQSIPCPPLR